MASARLPTELKALQITSWNTSSSKDVDSDEEVDPESESDARSGDDVEASTSIGGTLFLRVVTFSTVQMLEQQEAIKASLKAFFDGRECSISVTFHSGTHMTATMHKPMNNWTPSTSIDLDALLEAALSGAIWTISPLIPSPDVRVVTFSIRLSRQQQEALEEFLTTFSNKKEISLQVKFNTANKMTLHVTPPALRLNVDSLIIQALTAAQHPLVADVVLLPKGETWTLSKQADLGMVLGEGEAVSLSKVSLNNVVGRWEGNADWYIYRWVTFSTELLQKDEQSLVEMLQTNLARGKLSLTARFLSRTEMALKIVAMKSPTDVYPDFDAFINQALSTHRGPQGGLPSRTHWTIEPLTVRVAISSLTWVTSMSKAYMDVVGTSLYERQLSLKWWEWAHMTSRLVMYITPMNDRKRFPSNVDDDIKEALQEVMSLMEWNEVFDVLRI